MQIKPNVLIDYEWQQNRACADLLWATGNWRMNIDERDQKVADDEYEMNSWRDARNIVAPNDDRQKEKFSDRREHEPSE